MIFLFLFHGWNSRTFSREENVTRIWKKKEEEKMRILINNDADDLLFILKHYVRRKRREKNEAGAGERAGLIELGSD